MIMWCCWCSVGDRLRNRPTYQIIDMEQRAYVNEHGAVGTEQRAGVNGDESMGVAYKFL